MSYQFYIQDTRSLINDTSALFISDNQLTRWINQARKDVAKLTGCIQRLISGQSAQGAGAQPGNMIPGGIQPGALPGAITPATGFPYTSFNGMQTIPGVERYPFKGFFNPFLTQQYAGMKGVIDCVQLAITWETTFRPALTWMPWDDFQAYCRAYSNQTTSYPSVWSVFNDGEDGEVWMFPVPSSPCEIEAYVACMPMDIYSDADYDAIPEGFQSTIKFRAAELAFLSGQRYQQSQLMGQKFLEQAGLGVLSRDRGKTPNYYTKVL